MKFGLKIVAAAAALVSAISAQAAGGWEESSNPQVALVAYNQATRGWYIADLNVSMNAFLPTGTVLGCCEGPGLQGTVTPNAGYNVSQQLTGFSSWYSAQSATASSVRWFVAAGDAENFFDGNEARLILSSKSTLFPTGGAISADGMINISAGGSGLGGLGQLFPQGTMSEDGLSSVGSNAQVEWDTLYNFGTGANALALVGDTVSLYYFTRNGGAFSDGNAPVNIVRYGNTDYFSTLSLDAQGNFVYDLQAAAVSQVPLPASVWLMGAGLAAMGGVVRRRRAAAQA